MGELETHDMRILLCSLALVAIIDAQLKCVDHKWAIQGLHSAEGSTDYKPCCDSPSGERQVDRRICHRDNLKNDNDWAMVSVTGAFKLRDDIDESVWETAGVTSLLADHQARSVANGLLMFHTHTVNWEDRVV